MQQTCFTLVISVLITLNRSEIRVVPTQFHQFIVGSRFTDMAIVDNIDLIGMSRCLVEMRDQHSRLITAQTGETGENTFFRLGIDG